MKTLIYTFAVLTLILVIFFIDSGNLYPQVAQQWVKTYNGTGNGNDNATSMAVDTVYNCVYVAGSSHNPIPNLDYVIIKYNRFGDTVWTRRYDGGYGDDVPTKIIVDNFGYVYVTGRSMSSANGFDYCTIKYNRFGVQQWLRRYDNLATHQNDIANSMGVHTDGSVYVTGSTQISGNNHDYCTIKYNSIGVLQWDKTYDRAGDHDNAVSLVLDNFGNCYVTGACKYGPYRGVTIRYNKTLILGLSMTRAPATA